METKGFYLIWNHVLALSASFEYPCYGSTPIRPIYFLNSFDAGTVYYRRQNLTFKDGPRADRARACALYSRLNLVNVANLLLSSVRLWRRICYIGLHYHNNINSKSSRNADLLLGQRRRRCTNIKVAVGQRLVFCRLPRNPAWRDQVMVI